MERIRQVLGQLLEVLDGSGIVWALTGSTSFALQGVPVPVHDIDIQTDAAGAWALQDLLRPNTVRPVTFLESEKIRSYFGVFEIDGVRVEVMGALQKRLEQPEGGGYWETPVDVGALRIHVGWEGKRVPVLPLEYEYGAYLRLGRTERALLLKRHLVERTNRGALAVSCSTSPLARLAGATWSDGYATVQGVRLLGWPFVELRVWDEWNVPFVEVASEMCKHAHVLSVHAPAVTEEMMSLNDPGPIRSVLQRCTEAALVCGAKTVVVHAWDLRKKTFDKAGLLRNLRAEAQRLREEGLELSVENIPGHSSLLSEIAESCPEVKITVDTQWTALEESWDLVYSLAARVNNLHVQSYIDLVDGGVSLGRASGAYFDPARVLREFLERGFKGSITLEPKNVCGNDDHTLRAALVALKRLVT